MANSNGIITAPVRMTADVKAVLQETSNHLSVLCRSSRINKHARFKPIPRSQLSTITEADRLASNNGFTIKWLSFSYLNPTAPTWGQWRQPTGGMAEPYRLGDFNGYNHNAGPFIKDVKIVSDHYDGKTLICSNTNLGSLHVEVETYNWVQSALNWSHFQIDGRPLADMYLCAALLPLDGAQLNPQASVYAFSERLSAHPASAHFRFDLETAPNSALYNLMRSDPRAVLAIGIVSTTDRPIDFISPVVYPEMASMPWITLYTTYSENNGYEINEYYYARCGLRAPVLSAAVTTDNSGWYKYISITANEIFVMWQQTNQNGTDRSPQQQFYYDVVLHVALRYGNGTERELTITLLSEQGDSSGILNPSGDYAAQIPAEYEGTCTVRMWLEMRPIIKRQGQIIYNYIATGDYSTAYKRVTDPVTQILTINY